MLWGFRVECLSFLRVLKVKITVYGNNLIGLLTKDLKDIANRIRGLRFNEIVGSRIQGLGHSRLFKNSFRRQVQDCRFR